VVSRAISEGQPWLRRAVAVVWPRSTVYGARRAISAVADALDFIDFAAAKVRSRLLRRQPAV
jgi:hypothetical protein